MNLGKAVKVALAMKGVRQVDLAAKMGKHHVYISRLCNQEFIGMEALQNIAEALDMKVSELVALGEDK